MKLLIQNGHVIDPAAGRDGKYDILIEDTKVSEIAPHIEAERADQVVAASGCYVVPGFIDLHVHLRDPGLTYKETLATGSLAAAKGGFTSICPMPNTKPVTDTPEKIRALLERAKTESAVHILPIGAVTLGQEGGVITDMKGMAEAGAVGVSEDGKSVMNSQVYREGMKLARENGLVVMAHCEDKNLVNGGVMNAGAKAEELGLPGITNAVEDVIVARDILLAKETGAKLHLCHCSTADSVALTRLGRELGVDVTAEVCPHHFVMSCEEITEDHGRFKMNPPLRGKADVEALKKGLADGTMDCISTDHAPHAPEEKNCSMMQAAFGIVGLETAFALGYTCLVEAGVLSLNRLVELMTTKPAAVLGIGKGCIAEGRTADIAIVDVRESYRIDASAFASKGKNTPFDGMTVKGRVKATIVDGEVVYQG